MKLTSKIIGLVIAGIVGIGIIFSGAFLVMAFMSDREAQDNTKETGQTESEVSHSEIRKEVSSERKEEYPEESAFMQTIHEMTHQKVYADQKWGFTPITEEQIDKMLRTLDKVDYENEEFYRETLTFWKNGDFSNAVEVHNRIWEWQGGEIGKATRLLTPEEEQDYLYNQPKYTSPND